MKFIKRSVSILIIVVAWNIPFFNSCQAQTVDEIVSNYRKSLRNSSKLDAIKSMICTGTFYMQGLEFPVHLYFKPINNSRIEMEFQKMKFIIVTNDSLQWEYNPMTKENTITRHGSTGINKKSNHSFDYISADLLNYKQDNSKLVLTGKEKLDSLDVFVLELNKTDGKKSTFYLNQKSSLINKVVDETGYRFFAHYIISNEYVMPMYSIVKEPTQTLTINFNSARFNQPLQDTLFIVPNHAKLQQTQNEFTIESKFAKGENLRKIGKNDSALLLFNNILEKAPNHFRTLNSRGLVKISMEDYYGAIADFSLALNINSKDGNVFNNRGLAKYYLNDYKNALLDYSEGLTLLPESIIIIKNRGQAYISSEDYASAEADFRRVIELQPNDSEGHYKLAVSLAQLEKYEEALEEYRQTQVLKFDLAEFYNYKGVTEFRLESYDSAKQDFYTAWMKDQENAQYLENYGRALYELGEFTTARFHFDTYLNKYGDNAEVVNLKGLTRYSENDFKGAIEDFSKAIVLKENATYFDNRALAKEKIKDIEGAIHDYSESIRIYPTDASVFYKRGILKISISKTKEGCHDLSAANEMKYEPAKDALKKNCKKY